MKRYVVCRPMIGGGGIREMRLTESDSIDLPKKNLKDLRRAHPKREYWIYDRKTGERLY